MGAALGRIPSARGYTRLGGPVAQLAEQGTFNPKVAGSNPARPIEKDLETGYL